MKILGIIPARGGSKGIPGKNIKLLGDKPLIAYTAESAFQSELLDCCILSSDDKDIIAVANEIGLETPFARPQEFSIDTSPSLDLVLHALDFYKKKGVQFDAVCLLQPTTPFRGKNLIDTAIKEFIQKGLDSLISVREVPDQYNPHWVFEEKNGRLKLATGEKNIISRRQELPPAYFRDGAIYITSTEVLLNKKSLFGEKIGFVINSDLPYVNLDTPTDWTLAEKILKDLR